MDLIALSFYNMNHFQNSRFISAICFIDRIKILMPGYQARYRIGQAAHIIARLSILLIVLTAIPVCVCAEIQEKFFEDDSAEPWHIAADEMSYDHKTDQYVAKGNAVITKKRQETDC